MDTLRLFRRQRGGVGTPPRDPHNGWRRRGPTGSEPVPSDGIGGLSDGIFQGPVGGRSSTAVEVGSNPRARLWSTGKHLLSVNRVFRSPIMSACRLRKQRRAQRRSSRSVRSKSSDQTYIWPTLRGIRPLRWCFRIIQPTRIMRTRFQFMGRRRGTPRGDGMRQVRERRFLYHD